MKLYLSIAAAVCISIISCKKSAPVDCSTVTYSGTIKSVISSKCAVSGCHVSGSAIGNLNNYDILYSYYKSGRLKSSVVTRKIMPPTGRLSSTQISQFECWINNGAPNN